MKKVFVFVISILIMVSFGFTAIEGKFEVGFHYSYWTIDMIAPLLEDMTPELEHYDTEKGPLNFDSNGNNFGFEVRFFPAGKNGSFSLGISYERNNFKANLSGSYTELESDGIEWLKSIDGNIDLRPHSFNFSLRWELWPGSRVHPYLGLGLGFGSLTGTADYYVEKTDQGVPDPIIIYETDEKTLKELIDEYEADGESFPVSFFPIIHLNFGLRGEVIENVYLLAEFAVYDGFIFRGGLAYRF